MNGAEQLDVAAMLDILSTTGVVGLLSLALLALWRGWVVRSSEHSEALKERDRAREREDRWTRIALRGLGAASRGTDLADEATNTLEELQ